MQIEIEGGREEILGELISYLQDWGIDANLGKQSAIDYFGRDIEETVVQLSGQSLQEIRLYARIYGTGLIIYRFYYDVLFAELPSEVSRAVATKIKLVKEDKVIGLFGGKLVDIEWIGHDIAEQLNSDSSLRQRLFQYAGYFDAGQIQIYAASSSQVRLLGPKLMVSVNELHDESGRKKIKEDLRKLLDFEIYENIAEHIKKIPAANQISNL
ncbi:hypothetical protein ACFLWK_00035 [Chloroflexota bacterium]